MSGFSGKSRQFPANFPPAKFPPEKFIDSQDFAYNSRETQGKIPVAAMPRLQDVLAAPDGELSYIVRGMHSRVGKPMLEVTLDGLCQLRCQRCLQQLAYPVKLVSHLILVPPQQLNDAQLDEAAFDDEENDVIPADTRLDVLQLLEDELLLSLPFAPKHAAGTCQPAITRVEETDQAPKNPFAVLAELKNK